MTGSAWAVLGASKGKPRFFNGKWEALHPRGSLFPPLHPETPRRTVAKAYSIQYFIKYFIQCFIKCFFRYSYMEKRNQRKPTRRRQPLAWSHPTHAAPFKAFCANLQKITKPTTPRGAAVAGPVLSLQDKHQQAQKHRLEIFIEFMGEEVGTARKHQLYQTAVKGLKRTQNEVKRQRTGDILNSSAHK